MKKIKILAVEDEVKIANLIKKVLEMKNYAVELAHDGKSGLLKAKRTEYDLVVLDIMLPELNGIEVCKALRQKKSKVPIIMLTARDTIEDRISAASAGANDYLSKPFAFEDLLLKIEILLDDVKNQKTMKSPNIEAKNTNFEMKESKYPCEKNDRIAYFNKQVMDNAPVSIITINKEGYITSANKYYKTFSRNKNFKSHSLFKSEFFIREKLVDDYKKLLADGLMVQRENCYEKNNKGEDKYLKIIAVPLKNKDGNIGGALSMAIDNTEAALFKKRLEELNSELEKKVKKRTSQLNFANKELAKAIELKSMFVADVSHEMRTSLAIIQGNIELISRDLIAKEELEETSNQVFGEIKRMSTMLADLTLLSGSESSKYKLDYEKIDLNELIGSVCKSLQVVANEKGIKISHKNSINKIEIMADVSQLEKMLSNLIRNAIKYNRKNGWINVWVKEKNDEIFLKIKDSGIGIAKKHQEYIFERFYRVDKARSRSEGGSGLGLAICKWVAEMHNGKISVESKLGNGSIFTVNLPRIQKQDAKL